LPGCFRLLVHPLVDFTPLQSSSVPMPADVVSFAGAFPGIAMPSSRLQSVASMHRGSQPRCLSALGVSHALDGLLRHRPRGSISPHSHVQGSPYRVFLPLSRVASSATLCPLVVDPASLLMVAHQRRVVEPRPQGLAPCGRLVALTTVISSCASSLPSWASPPPGALSSVRDSAFTLSTAHDLGAEPLCHALH